MASEVVHPLADHLMNVIPKGEPSWLRMQQGYDRFVCDYYGFTYTPGYDTHDAVWSDFKIEIKKTKADMYFNALRYAREEYDDSVLTLFLHAHTDKSSLRGIFIVEGKPIRECIVGTDPAVHELVRTLSCRLPNQTMVRKNVSDLRAISLFSLYQEAR